MKLTPDQETQLRTAIAADPVANAYYVAGNLTALAAHMNTVASPDFWAWRIAVSRAEIYNAIDHEGGVWNWTTYKAQAATEQGAWTQMFMGDQADFSQDNVRAGVVAIFSGAGAPAEQRTHILSVGREKASRFEQVFAVGDGTPASPAKFGVGADGQRLQGTVPYTFYIGL